MRPEKCLNPLRRRALDDMSVRRFVPDTQRAYFGAADLQTTDGLIRPIKTGTRISLRTKRERCIEPCRGGKYAQTIVS